MICLSNDFSSFRSKRVSPCALPGLSHGSLLRPRWRWLFKRRCQDRCCRPARIKRFLWRRRRGLWVETLMSTVGVQRVFFTHSSSSGSKGSFILAAEFWRAVQRAIKPSWTARAGRANHWILFYTKHLCYLDPSGVYSGVSLEGWV